MFAPVTARGYKGVEEGSIKTAGRQAPFFWERIGLVSAQCARRIGLADSIGGKTSEQEQRHGFVPGASKLMVGAKAFAAGWNEENEMPWHDGEQPYSVDQSTSVRCLRVSMAPHTPCSVLGDAVAVNVCCWMPFRPSAHRQADGAAGPNC
ncbi:uncharacterized protein UV8b_01014 [Ustilaginoidea virens]|uniref:Uncharacterized protein n=1 Tax=Ustilaginoidea virens TaxID=1159556 RepID=A0A8E5MDZ1_USTVR|nr:uncharacterized protein UV8b_01014 [Ustilaginoidea virens]QUC16773.1 hypothetical protein UV8b_01014 [Ustilaginoidea virens]